MAGDEDVRWDELAPDTPAQAEAGLPGLGAATVGALVGAGLGLAIALVLRDAGYPGGRAVALAASSVGLWSGLLGACVYVSRRRGTGSFVRDMRWTFRPIDLGFGLAGSIAGRVIASAIIAPVPMPFRHVRDADRSLLDRATHGTSSWIILIIVVCIGAPIVEELFFRGLVQPRLVTRLGPVMGIVASSVLFGAAHLTAWQGTVTLAYALSVAGGGLVLGTLRHITGRLGPSTTAHAMFNAEALLAIALLS